ncbi:hypothetical protein [Stieleria sp.]|uniref:hypothetical protein n=1 Tax=Stieleria sp. TaxID=2795976 RepID=UPI00356585D8
MNLIRTIFEHRRVSPGWAMPMGWFAWFGMMIPVMFEINGWLQNVVLAWSGWLTLWVTGLVGTASIGYESVRNIGRYGINGMERPRFFFELSRAMIAAIFLLCMPALTFTLLLPNLNAAFADFINLRNVGIALAICFALSASCGYVLSFISGRPRRGRAYECTSWFFCLCGGMILITFGYIAIPDPPKDVASAIPGTVACALGVGLLVCGILAEAAREKRTDPSRAPEDGLRGF